MVAGSREAAWPTTVSLSRVQRGRADDQGVLDAPLVASGAKRAASLLGGRLRLSWQTVAADGLPGHLLATLTCDSPIAELASAGWRWLRLGGIPLPAGTEAALANGYNGWSESPLLTQGSVLRGENNPAQEPFADHDFYQYAERPGCFHSWSFSYLQIRGSDTAAFANAWFGALAEERLNTVFEFDLAAGQVQLALDLAGAQRTLSEGAPVLGQWLMPDPAADWGAGSPTLAEAAKIWGQLVVQRRAGQDLGADDDPRTSAAGALPLRGYTSWYYRYRQIDEAWLRQNLLALTPHREWHVFQVDDGYQELVGDWTRFSAGFPRGVKPLFAEATARGLTPGIWCAPFVALAASAVFRQHPDWFLRDQEGELVLCGDFAHWGGPFYALDTERPEVLAHIAGFLATMVDEWGARFIKADFLYAAAKIPAGGRSRAERGERAHRFLHGWCAARGVTLLSCGASMASSYGNCEFARLGPDVLPEWEEPNSRQFTSREKCSTRASVLNAVTRFPLDGAVFRGDPDVFILRRDGNRMTPHQRATLAAVNGLLGSLVFCSDLLSDYDDATRAMLVQVEATRRTLGMHHAERLGLGRGADGNLNEAELTLVTSGGVFGLELSEEPQFHAALATRAVD